MPQAPQNFKEGWNEQSFLDKWPEMCRRARVGKESLYIVDGNADWLSFDENQEGDSSKY